MANSYNQLQKQIQALKQQAEEVRAEEVSGVIAKIKDAIESYGLQPQDLFGARFASKKSKTRLSADAKYSDGQGNTWVGRGPRPLWLRDALAAGHSLEDFAV